MLGRFSHSDFDLESLRSGKDRTISVVLPTRQVAATVGDIVASLRALDGLIDEVIVIDAASDDNTAECARIAGADVYQEGELLAQFGPVLGKGDAMWRALSVASGELVCFLDADTTAFGRRFAVGLLGPLLTRQGVRFVKGNFTRPFVSSGVSLPKEGGRVTELTARPLLSAFYSELARFGQPLAGEVCAERSLLEAIPFATGYAVEISMLLEVHARIGLSQMAEVDLGERRNKHKPLRALGPMAHEVLTAVVERLRSEGRFPASERLDPFVCADGLVIDSTYIQRPPLATLSLH